jgi:hypothetical protein
MIPKTLHYMCNELCEDSGVEFIEPTNISK